MLAGEQREFIYVLHHKVPLCLMLEALRKERESKLLSLIMPLIAFQTVQVQDPYSFIGAMLDFYK